jgi:PEP-CTERM motif
VRARWGYHFSLAAVGGALFICSLHVGATTFNVSIDSAGFAGSSATLAFDFVDGGPPSNTVNLSALTSNGTQGATSTTGSVSGTGPWTFSDASFFNELLVPFGPLGTSISFSFSTTDNPPAGGSSPDEFSFLVLDSLAQSALITTNAPDGLNELFAFDITGLRAGGLTVYTPDQNGFSIRVRAPAAIPEPGSLALLAGGFVAFFVRKRFGSSPQSRTRLQSVQGRRDGPWGARSRWSTPMGA